MIAIEIREPGGPDVLTPTERPTPVPGPGEILLKVAAAGVNRPDVFQRLGRYPPPPGATDIPGLEVSGVVARSGEKGSRWKEGDRVVALLAGGGYAEYCLVHESSVLPLPTDLSFVEGAGLPETTFTVWHNVFQRGRLSRDEWLLVHGGTSGIGTTAIQLGKAFSARVAATAGSDRKCQAAQRLGADCVINYRTQDFVSIVRQATNEKGADVILDMVGGDYLGRNIAAAAEDGRIVQISTLAGPMAQLDLWKLLSKRLVLTGSTLRNRSLEFKGALARSIEEMVWPVIAEGRYRPVIDAVFPLRDAAAAHRRLEGGEHIGKIILQVAAL
jgi:putative PIG3 family NAD(P)H quinone oxidoreductase